MSRNRLWVVLAAGLVSGLTGLSLIFFPSSPSPATVGTVELSAGSASFGQVFPQGVVWESVQVGSLPTQTDALCWWDDGSVRFARVHVEVPATGNYSLIDGPADQNKLQQTAPPPFWVLFNVGDEVFFTPPIPTNPNQWDIFAEGPLVAEGRIVLTPRSISGDHPFLRVVLDLQQRVGGKWTFDAAVENCFHDLGDLVVYDVSWGIGRTTYGTRDEVRHHYLTRYRITTRVTDGGAAWSLSDSTPDISLFVAAGAIPDYSSNIQNVISDPTGGQFEILQIGDLHGFMPAHGGRPELAPYPDWTARYLAHKDQTQKRYVLRHGDLSGTWPVHVRKMDGDFVNLDDFPTYWIDVGWGRENRGPQGNILAVGSNVPDNAHQPSLALVPWLLTGERYYADELAAWGHFILLSSHRDQNDPNAVKGLLSGEEVRGIGWGVRTLADAAAYLPYRSLDRAYLLTRLRYNLDWLDQISGGAGPLGILWTGWRLENWDESFYQWWIVSTWEQSYLAWAIDRANGHGFDGGTLHRDQVVNLVYNLFTTPETKQNAAPYLLYVGTQNPPGSRNVTYFTNYAQMSVSPPCPFAWFYGPAARLILQIAERQGRPQARELIDWLERQSEMMNDLTSRAGWYTR